MKKWVKTLIILLIIGLFIIAGVFIAGRSMRLAAQANLAKIEKYTITRGDLSLTAIGSGKIVSGDIKKVIPAGTLTEITVAVGDVVKKDDLLARYTDMTGTKHDFKSEYSGVVTAVPSAGSAMLGQSAKAEFEISSTASLEMNVQITERDIYKLKVDQTASIYIEALDTSFDGSVSRISYAGNTAGDFTIYDVTVGFDTDNEDIFLGMTGSAKIKIDTKNDVFKVPVDAIIEDGDKRYLLKGEWLRNTTKAQKDYYVEIKTGLSDSDFVEITSGASANMEILIVPQDTSAFPGFMGRVR